MADEIEQRQDVEGGESESQVKAGSATRTGIYALAGGLVLFFAAIIATDTGILPERDSATDDRAEGVIGASVAPASFTPPPVSTIPAGPAGDAIKRGMEIFTNTQTNASQFVGNGLNCSNCHLNAGRQPDSAPLWAAWVQYPKYRSKNKKINTMEDRVNGCFSYSMNAQNSPSGGPPPKGHDVYKDLQAYMYWLATGAPTGAEMKGGGYLKLKLSKAGYDPNRGSEVFARNCATCHGADGQGQKDINGRYIFPPLWGSDSYNWGAGMARVDNAAGFIKANMPLGQGGKLTDQEAWDAAAFVNMHERPKDPRQKGTVLEAAKEFHGGEESYYGKTMNGKLIGVGTPAEARMAVASTSGSKDPKAGTAESR